MTTLATACSTTQHHAERTNLSLLIAAAQSASTPSLIVSPSQISANYRRLRHAFPQAHIYYAVKANPHPSVIDALASEGCGIDIASGPELAMAQAHAIDPLAVCFSAPFKRARDITAARAYGVDLFVADAPSEVSSIARHAPGARLLLRAAVSGGKSLTPMGKKFGANMQDLRALAAQAQAEGLPVCGFHFHVGSQCLDPLAWSQAVAECAPVWHALRRAGHDLTLLDIGGGFPVAYDCPVPAIEEIARATLAAIRVWLGAEVQVCLEPGRWMTDDAAYLVTEVIGKARRGCEDWVYLDAGVYNGLIDTTEGVRYPMHTPDELITGSKRPRTHVTLAGPSCDGNDVMMHHIEAPFLEVGDRVLFSQAGAYTTAFEHFNGLDFPSVTPLVA